MQKHHIRFYKGRAALAGLLCVMLSLPAWADVHSYTLDNGLQLFVKTDHRVPIATTQVWYKVGSSYEYGGITGISHILEHMMFKGTSRYPEGEFSRLIAMKGGQENAFTGRDYTGYFQDVAAQQVALSFELEADRMQHLILNEAAFEKERQVVIEERRLRTDDNPQAATYEQFSATAFLSGPYHHLPIGWMNDLEHMTKADLERWYKKWYAPNNAIIIVVGDVDPKKMHRLAKKYFGDIPAGDLGMLKPQEEIDILGERRITVRKPAQLPYLLMGYPVPVINTAADDAEPYALSVLAAVLGGGASSRLQKEVVRDQGIVTQVSASYDPFMRLGTQFMLSATPAQGHSVEEVEQALMAEIARVQAKPISKSELERVITQMTAEQIYAQDSISYQAYLIGSLESVGLPWQLMDDYLIYIKQVTPQQVQAVAKKYLTAPRLTVAELEPLAINEEHADA